MFLGMNIPAFSRPRHAIARLCTSVTLVLVFFIAPTPTVLRAQNAPTDLQEQLPFYEGVLHGRLDNGLEYFARHHPYPANTVVLRMIVDAGSVHETDSQRGLAHFIEHMAFNGTQHFGETELVAYLEGIGMRFGPDINAQTGFDETIYKLEVPIETPGALRTGLRVMREWASAITFEHKAIDRERGVIIEEWRGSQGASTRMLHKHLPYLFGDSLYAQRLPIGEMDIVRNAPREEFLRYYKRWYRPDNIAIIAVGDLPAEQLVAEISAAFTPLPRPSTPLKRPYPTTVRPSVAQVSIATDTEAAASVVSIYNLTNPFPSQTVGDYRERLVTTLFSMVVNERLREITQNADAPFTSSGIGYSRFMRDTAIYGATATAKAGRELDTYETLLRELERVNQYGVLESELERAKRRLFEGVEEIATNEATQPAEFLAEELVRHWTEGESVPGITTEHHLYKTLLPTVTTDEVNQVAPRFIDYDTHLTLANIRIDHSGTLPTGETAPTVSQFQQATLRARTAALAPPREEEGELTLLRSQPSPGTVVSDTNLTAEIRLVTMSNGVRLYLHPTNLVNDEILVTVISPGGTSLLPDELVPAANLFAAVWGRSGVGQLDARQTRNYLAGSSVSLTPFIRRTREGFDASVRREDLPTLFQAMYALTRFPRLDQKALLNVQAEARQAITSAMATPQGRFSRRLQELYAGGDPRITPLTTEEVNAVTLDDLWAIYNHRFTNPADFAIVVVGSFDETEVIELAMRYTASLPLEQPLPTPARFIEQVAALPYTPPKEVSETVYAGREPVANYVLISHGSFTGTPYEEYTFRSAVDLLDIRLREAIREEEGGAYSIGAGGWIEREPNNRYYVQLGFGLDPARSEELLERTRAVLQATATEPIDPQYITRIRSQQRESYAQAAQTNAYWRNEIVEALLEHRSLDTIDQTPTWIERVTVEDVERAARTYLNGGGALEVLLLPEEERR